MIMADQWYVSRQGQEHGPYTWEEMIFYAREGNISPGDPVWSSSTGAWVQASQVAGLVPAAAVPVTVHPAPPASKAKLTPILLAGGGLLAVLVTVAAFAALVSIWPDRSNSSGGGGQGPPPSLPGENTTATAASGNGEVKSDSGSEYQDILDMLPGEERIRIQFTVPVGVAGYALTEGLRWDGDSFFGETWINELADRERNNGFTRVEGQLVDGGKAITLEYTHEHEQIRGTIDSSGSFAPNFRQTNKVHIALEKVPLDPVSSRHLGSPAYSLDLDGSTLPQHVKKFESERITYSGWPDATPFTSEVVELGETPSLSIVFRWRGHGW